MNSLQERRLNSRFDHAVYGLKPKHHHNAQAATLNDDLPYQIAAGNVVIKPNIRRMTETGVEFEDGSVVDDIDIVVYANGIRVRLSIHESSSICRGKQPSQSVQVCLSAGCSASNCCSNWLRSTSWRHFSNIRAAMSMGYQSLQGIFVVFVPY